MKKTFWQRLKEVGPGAVVAAAFIGPGTVTSCSLSGANYGYALLWAILFSTISVIIMQSMASRLGIVTGKGLGEALREKFTGKASRIILAVLVIAAVFIGNVAYETGNVSGAALGLQATNSAWIDNSTVKIILAVIIGVVAFGLLFSGSNKYIEKILTGLVVIMGILFLICAIAVKPDWLEVLKGLFVPTAPESKDGTPSWMTIAALMGTTVVPYNIYLHASSSAKKWNNPEEDIKTSNLDSILAIGLGGIISLAIIVCASACKSAQGADFVIKNGGDMALSLKPLLGSWATTIFGIGLFAAGFSSAITAPLAAAYATSGILGWGEDMKKWRFKIIWMIVLAFGIVATCTLGASPQEIILFAQAANAILLPITAVLLLIVSNDKKLMGNYKNGIVINILAVIVIGVFLFIAARNMTAFVDSAKALFNK
ncbi:MAG: Nramp family divalent metal transporter [Clostridiales bacterium]|nr:Nramp family divalent metal transporter [Candidatus Equinaster intestinalis]